MKKRKRYYSKRGKLKGSAKGTHTDAHHLCYQARHFSRGPLLELRQYYYCKVLIPKETLHKEIHESLRDVPAPKPINAAEALKHLRFLTARGAIGEDDPIEKRLAILAALFDYCEQPTADAFRKQLEIIHRCKKAPP